MRIFSSSLLICLLFTLSLAAQETRFTVEAITSGEFRTEGLDVLRSLKNGKEYAVLNFDRESRTTSVDSYDYETRQKTATLVNSSDLEGVQYFTSYEFSEDENLLLLATEVEPVFRRSTLGVYYIYNRTTKALDKIADEKIQEPTFSPDGSKVAYVFQNNIYVKDLENGELTQVTEDGKVNSIINGVTDWVYEEEFGFVRAFDWNSAGNRIAFIRFDESEVPEFSMDVYGSELYQSQHVFKYPKAGEKNASVSLHIHELGGETRKVDLGNPYYIPRIKWMNHPDYLSVQTINRNQNDLKLHAVDATDLSNTVLLQEKDDAYVDIHDNLTFLEDDSFIWTSEKDGWNHIYLYNEDGDLMEQLTKGDWEVTQYYGYDQAEDRVYYQSSENGSINRDIYSISSSGKDKLRLTRGDGTNAADFSADFTYFINSFSNAKTPPVYTLHRAIDGKELMRIKDNSALEKKLESYPLSPKEFSTLRINGYDLNMWMIKPVNFDPKKKYPLLLFQYSGPGSQQVANRWLGDRDYWHQLLANEGYIVACVDGRGTGLKGRDFKKMTYQELGKLEVEDQIEIAKTLSKRDYIDPDRTGIWGWSYGGFMSTNCLLKGNDTFEMAIAVAPVTSWRFYDTIYTERYMRTPQENASGYDDNSPLSYPELLKGKYLLIHGSGDDNVHVQHTMRMVEALIQADKQFDWAIYPDKNHGIYGGNTRKHLYTKMTLFIKENL